MAELRTEAKSRNDMITWLEGQVKKAQQVLPHNHGSRMFLAQARLLCHASNPALQQWLPECCDAPR